MQPFHHLLLLLLLFSLSTAIHHPPPLPSDAVSLLTFKSKADLDNTLNYTPFPTPFPHCQWQGVKCQNNRIVRLTLPSHSLRGTFPPHSLSLLDQLRVLVLRNNSLSGPLPSDLSHLSSLRSLILGLNLFSGPIPLPLLSLHRLRALDFSHNNLSGHIPATLLSLDRLLSLDLRFNRFTGPLPPINMSELEIFNVSGNNLSGEVPSTTILSRFPPSSFSLNPSLCGEVVNKPCDRPSTFFNSSSTAESTATNRPPASADSVSFLSPPPPTKDKRRKAVVIAFSVSAAFLTSSILCLALAARRRRRRESVKLRDDVIGDGDSGVPASDTVDPEVIRVRLDSQSNELREKCRELVEGGVGLKKEIQNNNNSNLNNNNNINNKSGNLVFSVGEVKLYTLEQLMRASAEMLGRGTVGTTYKAKLDSQLIVTVKRLDAIKMGGVNGEMFERHMEVVGALRHPNLVPVRAYFQAREERLIIFDYQPNGSVFSLIHGSRSTRAKPLHWTSCLKIADDVAQGLAYVHQASNLTHGNLKASNVLLGADFEACLTDFCLATLASPLSDNDDPDSTRYTAPEARGSTRRATPKSDVYAFGVLLLELLSGRSPSEHPFLAPPDMPKWVRAMRGDSDGYEDNNQLSMLVEVASLCSLTSPEQRPAMWQVLKMIHRIKATVSPNEAVDPPSGFS